MSQQPLTTESEEPRSSQLRIDELNFLWLELTTKCNLECIHCYSDSGPGLPLLQGMSYEKWLKVLREGFELDCRSIQFIGGEPTLYPQLLQLIRDARDIGYEYIEVFTNGTLINQEMFETFRDCGVCLALSVYGSGGNTHDAITKRAGSFSKTMETIRKAVEYQIPVRAALVRMGENDGDIKATKRLLREAGVKAIKTDRLRGVGRGNQTLQARDQMAEMCESCGKGQLAIDPDGNVYPCVFSRFYKVGHVSNGLQSILGDETLHSYRRHMRARPRT